jgi:hypothetical protein
MKAMFQRSFWPRILVILGSLGMLIGALDPLEGSGIILIGSALMVLGTLLDPNTTSHHWFGYRLMVFVLVGIGVGAMWVLSAVGGIGGGSGHTMWWGLLILPYLIGWSMGICGPGNPRWMLILGIVVGLWYLTLSAMVASHHFKISSSWLIIMIGTTGLVTIAGCVARLRHFHSLNTKP